MAKLRDCEPIRLAEPLNDGKISHADDYGKKIVNEALFPLPVN